MGGLFVCLFFAGTVLSMCSHGDALSRSTAVTSDDRNAAFGHNLETFSAEQRTKVRMEIREKKKIKKLKTQNNCGWLEERAWTVTGST